MPRPVLALVLVLLGSGTLVSPATAQGNGTPRGKFGLSLGTAVIGFPAPGISDLDTGWVDHPGIVVSVQSRPPRTAWELRLRAAGPDMGGYGKPAGDILWRTDGSSAWAPLTQTDQMVLQGQGDQDVTVYFRLRVGWETDPPGTYSVGIVFSGTRL
jgi:hypothetical protein